MLMPHKELCTCSNYDCPFHPQKHNHECTECIEKNLRRHEIPSCFYHKIGEKAHEKSKYSFYQFAKKVMEREEE
jgi:hypothetical protein